MSGTRFARYIGIDYSGAQTAQSALKGLRVYEATRDADAVQVLPSSSARRHWSREGLAHWIVDRLSDGVPTIVGIDHGFSFPLRYFEAHGLTTDWPQFLEDFQVHWPTDQVHVSVELVRKGVVGHGHARGGDARWRRVAELRARAKSVFHFDVPGSVAKSTHAGLPWVLYLRRRLGHQVHFWPFDGWDVPAGRCAVLEIYPSLWSKTYPSFGRTPDEHDAYVAATRLKEMDGDGSLIRYLNPELQAHECELARVEGWILGVT